MRLLTKSQSKNLDKTSVNKYKIPEIYPWKEVENIFTKLPTLKSFLNKTNILIFVIILEELKISFAAIYSRLRILNILYKGGLEVMHSS